MLIQVYQEKWKEDFSRIRNVLIDVLLNDDIQIEHVGSTAVPGLDAKPIIDIDIIFSHPHQFETVKSRLEALGYFHNGNQGIPDREVFKRKNFSDQHPVLDLTIHHLYVCPAHSEELKYHMLFRDLLIANPATRLQYQALKYKIAEQAQQDKRKYAALKEVEAASFINTSLASANQRLNDPNNISVPRDIPMT